MESIAPEQLLIAFLNACAGAAIAVWAFWRLNSTRGHGDWWLKLSVLTTFAAAVWFGWAKSQAALATSSWDEPVFGLAIAAYLWCGVWKHYRRDQRRERRA